MTKAEEIVVGSTLLATIRSEFSKGNSEDLEKDLLRMVNQALSQHDVSGRSEQLPCSHCGRPLKEHSKDSKLCPDRMKNFEQGN